MEAEILAATSLLVEGIQLKQMIQFLLGDNGGLSNNAKVKMRLWLDSTSAQSFFNRLGPGRAKHLSTRILWSQQAMRKKWFTVERVSTKENPADLNTKPLSKERREYLMKKIGLCSETFENKPENEGVKVKQIVRLKKTAILAAGNLQGCDDVPMTWTRSMATWVNPMTWTPTAWWTLTTILLVSVIGYLLNKVNKLNVQMLKYKEVWTAIRETMDLQDQQDPFVQDALPDARQDPFSGVWYNQEASEEEDGEVDDVVNQNPAVLQGVDRIVDAMEELDREVPPQPDRLLLRNGVHGACAGDGENGENEEEGPDGNPDRDEVRAEGSGGTSAVPTTEEGIAIMTNAIAEIMDAAEGHGAGTTTNESDDDWIDRMEESPGDRYRRYIQSTQDEVSDPDEWADVHYGPRRTSSRSRSREGSTPASSPLVPERRAMPKILAEQRDRRLADERAEEMVRRAEAERERRGVEVSAPSAGSSSTTPLPVDDNINYFQDSVEIANFYRIGLVPREAAAFDDFRWDLIMQGVGPETILVNNCRELSRFIFDCTDVVQRAALQRLLRSLQSLLVMFQSEDPHLWIDAAYNMKGWLEADRDWSYFEFGSTDDGSNRDEGEGEEEDQDDDDEEDPQDRILRKRNLEERERDDPGDDDGGEGDGGRPSTWDYDDGA